MSYPKGLEPGDTIMFVAPSSALDREQTLLAQRRLEDRGYRVEYRDDLFARHGYLAGNDERRAEELMQAFSNPRVKAVFAGRGGIGAMRILDRLDYEKIRANPKLLLAASDITALHLALNRLVGLVTYHGPNLPLGLGSKAGLTAFTDKYFFQAVEQSDGEGRPRATSYTIDLPEGVPRPIVLGSGRARGRLTGGNLSLVAALEGTPYAIDTKDAVLLLEETREAAYRVDRTLCQLKLAGKLDSLRGAVLGQFTRVEEHDPFRVEDSRFSVTGLLRQYFEPLKIPVLMNYPVGHTDTNVVLPLGGHVEVDADRGVLRVLGGPG